ncbi:hypothetical protein [Desulfonatronovibrio hydrogenovorans]|uniref:hypothetical protein n=1 Tax=Desulfonatronovibrio hydrogenovorans TaxID=53245 RepID=UPI000AD024CC|nr:hypothetical protein [Desulfonatronovibrio hydrogenovorans]
MKKRPEPTGSGLFFIHQHTPGTAGLIVTGCLLSRFIERVHHVYDPLHYFWEHKTTRKMVTLTLIGVFLVSLILIELNRFSLLPGLLSEIIPTNPFYAVKLAFSLLLISEVISLIFILPCSVSRAVGKQFEILALIFLRNAFKELIHFSEPIKLAGQLDAVLRIGAYGLGALTIFVLLSFYYRQQVKREEAGSGGVLFQFVGAKKMVALILLFLFSALAAYNVAAWFMPHDGVEFFAEFYTILVFSDVLIVLISHSFFPQFKDIFRNSGFAISTLLMRLSLTAPPYYDVLIGVGAAVFALFLAMAYKRSFK